MKQRERGRGGKEILKGMFLLKVGGPQYFLRYGMEQCIHIIYVFIRLRTDFVVILKIKNKLAILFSLKF